MGPARRRALAAKAADHDVFTPTQYQVMRQRKEYANAMGLSRAAIFSAVEASLARLDTTYIDLYQIHRFDPDTPPEETMKALHDLVEAGKVRYIGASSMWAWQFSELNHVAEKHNWTKFVSMQNEYSLLYREDVRSRFFFTHLRLDILTYVTQLRLQRVGTRADPILQLPRYRHHPMGSSQRRPTRTSLRRTNHSNRMG